LKKIIIIGPAYPYRGGNSLFVSYLYDTLKNDFNVKIYNYKLLYPSILFPGTSQYDKSGEIIKQAPNERLVNSIFPFNWIKVANKISIEKPDLIVFDWWHPFFAFCHRGITEFLNKDLKKRILFVTENFVSHEGNFVDRFLTKIGLKNATSFLALSAKVEEELKEISNGRRIYRSELPVYDCYDADKSIDSSSAREAFGLSSDSLVLLFFGYIRKYKGLDLLIDAFPLIHKRLPNAKLLIVGESYDDISFYEDKISHSGCADSIILENKFVPNEDVAKYYHASDLVILPYRSATQSGILNVAYGFSKPVLVTNVGGLAEFVYEDRTGFVVKPDSSEELVRGVTRFNEMRNVVNFKENIKNFVQRNNFANIVPLFHQIVNDVQK
jgi:glycosyltransferase involved in cell wall biosynthesis